MTVSSKQSAIDFLQSVIAGYIDEAYDKYIDPNGKHHNAFFPPGFTALKQGMKDNHTQFPNKHFTIKHILEDGDLVAVHSHLVLTPIEKEMTVVHLFRFQNGKIVEMWDCGQPNPVESPNTDGLF